MERGCKQGTSRSFYSKAVGPEIGPFWDPQRLTHLGNQLELTTHAVPRNAVGPGIGPFLDLGVNWSVTWIWELT